MKFVTLSAFCLCLTGLAAGFIQLQPQPSPVLQARQPGAPPQGAPPAQPVLPLGQPPRPMAPMMNATRPMIMNQTDPITGRSLLNPFSFFGGEEKGGGKHHKDDDYDEKEDKKDHFKDLKQHFEDKKKAKLKAKEDKEYDDYDKKGKGKAKYDDGKDYDKEYDKEYAKAPPPKYPPGKYPPGKYPDPDYPAGKYPDSDYPPAKYPPGKYPDPDYRHKPSADYDEKDYKEPKGKAHKGKDYDDDYEPKGKHKGKPYDADDDYHKLPDSPPIYPTGDFYKVDANIKGKYIPQYRMTPANQAPPAGNVRSVPQMLSFQRADMLPNNTRMFHAVLRSSPNDYTQQRYRSIEARSNPPSPSYPPPAGAPAYSAAPPAPAPVKQYPSSAPYAAAAAPPKPAAYAPPPPASYNSSGSGYDEVSIDDYTRAKMKLFPVRIQSTAPAIEINNYGEPSLGGGGGYAPPPPPPVYQDAGVYPPPPAPYHDAGAYIPSANVLPPILDYSSHPIIPPDYGPGPVVPDYGGVPVPVSRDFKMPVAVVNLFCSLGKKCQCTLYLTEINSFNMLISGVCSGLPKNKFFSLHIFDYGDITHGCDSLGAHFNPRNSIHGSTNGPSNHAGDLGNLKSDENGVAFVNKLKRDRLTVPCPAYGGESYSILGRALGLSDAKDDYGLGANYGSLQNGNSGKIIACGVIGLANKENSYETRELNLAMAQAAAQTQAFKAKKEVKDEEEEKTDDAKTQNDEGNDKTDKAKEKETTTTASS